MSSDVFRSSDSPPGPPGYQRYLVTGSYEVLVMSGYYVRRPDPKESEKSEDYQSLAEEFPAVAAFLLGRPIGHPDGAECKGTIQIFLDSGKLKFCLSPKVGRDVAFGTIPDPTQPMESLEAQIVKGAYEWKTRR